MYIYNIKSNESIDDSVVSVVHALSLILMQSCNCLIEDNDQHCIYSKLYILSIYEKVRRVRNALLNSNVSVRSLS